MDTAAFREEQPMKTYLQASDLPTTRVGQVELPRLIMGIHPYDGCSYVSAERDAENLRRFGTAGSVAEVLRVAIEEMGLTTVQVDHMEPVLDRLHLQAIWEAERLTGVQLGLVAYLLIPIAFKGADVTYSERAHSTLYAGNYAAAGAAFDAKIRSDDIMHYLLREDPSKLVTPASVPPFSPEEVEQLEIDYRLLERYLGFFEGCEILVMDPGAEIDVLAMTGRFDLIREYLAYLRGQYDTVITSVHHAGVTIPLLEEQGIEVDAYLTPVNRPGTAMYPTPEMALDAIRQASVPVLAIKPMAGGRHLGRKAFEYVFDEVGVDGCMFGLGTVAQVRETASAAREVLGVG
jgi:hypothetical protein